MTAAFDDLRYEPTALRTKERLGPSAATHSEQDGLGFRHFALGDAIGGRSRDGKFIRRIGRLLRRG